MKHNAGFSFSYLPFSFTESKQPRTPAAKTGRDALDSKASLLSETKAVKKCKIKISVIFLFNNILLNIFF